MKCSLKHKMLVVVLLISCPVVTLSWEKYEHQNLADLALDSTLSFCEIKFTDSLIFIPGERDDIILGKMP